MKRILLLLLLFQLSSPAYDIGMSHESNLSSAALRIYAQIETNATTEAEFRSFLQDNTVIVIGSGISLSERLLLEDVKAQNPWLANAEEMDDGIKTLNAIEGGGFPFVVLVGGPEQNNVTRHAVSAGWFNETYAIELGFIVKSGKIANGTVAMSLSDKAGYEKGLKRESTAYSPLSAFMPQEYVPVAATGISLILLALFNVGRTVFEFKALDIGRKGKKVGEGARFVRGINVSELLAILGASLVLGVSISWQYFAGGQDFLFWLAVNSAICLFAAILHEVTHRLFAIYYGIKVEYRFWPAGSALTLVSSYLGNAFSVQAFLLEEIPEDVPKWKVGLMKLSAPVVSAAVMVAFAVLNYASPNPIYTIIYTTSALWAMTEMLPFSSLDGKDIRDWNGNVWFIAFSLICISYIVVTFLL